MPNRCVSGFDHPSLLGQHVFQRDPHILVGNPGNPLTVLPLFHFHPVRTQPRGASLTLVHGGVDPTQISRCLFRRECIWFLQHHCSSYLWIISHPSSHHLQFGFPKATLEKRRKGTDGGGCRDDPDTRRSNLEHRQYKNRTRS